MLKARWASTAGGADAEGEGGEAQRPARFSSGPGEAPHADGGSSRRRKAFAVHTGAPRESYACGDVRGFGEAIAAADDPRAPLPPRLALASPSRPLAAWLDRWAEDVEQVRRTLTIRRLADGRGVTVVATIASFGPGVETSLAVESISPPWEEGGPSIILRSGIHPRAAVEAALGLRVSDEG